MISSSSRLRRGPTAALTVGVTIAIVVLSAGLVWACVPQPLISLEPRSSGPSGSEVEVKALSLSGGRAEVRWNAIDGEVLATGGGNELSETITIPQAPAGLYSIILIERDPSGAVGASGRAAFLVTDRSEPPATSGEDAGATEENGPDTPASSSGSVSAPVAGLGGAGLLVVGLFAGSFLSRRRGRKGA